VEFSQSNSSKERIQKDKKKVPFISSVVPNEEKYLNSPVKPLIKANSPMNFYNNDVIGMNRDIQ
jgi:hypothetical protein